MVSELLTLSEFLEVGPEALELLAAYEARSILGPRYRNDMLHIAVATVGEVDVVVSWNFKHIVRASQVANHGLQADAPQAPRR